MCQTGPACLHPPSGGLLGVQSCLAFYVGAVNSNPGPSPCTAKALTHRAVS